MQILPEIKIAQKDKANKTIIDYGLKTAAEADCNGQPVDQLDEVMANFYGDKVKALRLGKMASEFDSQLQKSNDKDKDDTCSSIFS